MSDLIYGNFFMKTQYSWTKILKNYSYVVFMFSTAFKDWKKDAGERLENLEGNRYKILTV